MKRFLFLFLLLLTSKLFAIDFDYIRLGSDFVDVQLQLKTDGFKVSVDDNNGWTALKENELIEDIKLKSIKYSFTNNKLSSVCYIVDCNNYKDICKLYDYFNKQVYMKDLRLYTYVNTNTKNINTKTIIADNSIYLVILHLLEVDNSKPSICSIELSLKKD